MSRAADKAYFIIREAILNGNLKEAEKKLLRRTWLNSVRSAVHPFAMH